MNRFIRLKGMNKEFNDTYVNIDNIVYIQEFKTIMNALNTDYETTIKIINNINNTLTTIVSWKFEEKIKNL